MFREPAGSNGQAHCLTTPGYNATALGVRVWLTDPQSGCTGHSGLKSISDTTVWAQSTDGQIVTPSKTLIPCKGCFILMFFPPF